MAAKYYVSYFSGPLSKSGLDGIKKDIEDLFSIKPYWAFLNAEIDIENNIVGVLLKGLPGGETTLVPGFIFFDESKERQPDIITEVISELFDSPNAPCEYITFDKNEICTLFFYLQYPPR